MDYSTLAQALAQDIDGVVFDLESLYSRLLTLTDRRHRRGIRYALPVILVAVILAKLAGEDTPNGIADWVQHRQDFFIQVFELNRSRMPHAMTYRRVLADAGLKTELEQVTRAYLLSRPGAGQSVQVTLDGKKVRGVLLTDGSHGLYLLAAYLPAEGLVVMQVEVPPQTNEIGVAPQVLKVLDLQGKIVTGDALLTQCALSRWIVEAGGDYVWTVKDNQPQLRQDIEHLFAPEVCLPDTSPVITDRQTVQTVEKSHGRLETRTLTTSSAWPESSEWPSLSQVFQLDRCRVNLRTGEVQTETVYGVTSLSAQAADPARLLALQRGQWAIENGLHYRRDVTLHEDAGRTSSPCFGQVMAILNNLVIGLTIGRGW